MEVTLSSSDGLYLKDVINRLNELRGKGMASLYSWSSKRSYKNGFVWHDLSEEDFIFPVQGQEYVLKGSEVLDSCLLSNPRSILGTTSFRDPRSLNPEKNSGDDIPPVVHRRRNQSWSSIDLSEYKVYKAPTESTAESTRRLGADAATQTEERRRRRKAAKEEEVESPASYERHRSTELSRDEISPPPSDSSPETLENLIKADGRLILRQGESSDDHRTVETLSSGRMRASAVLMQLISCGTMSFKECGPVLLKDHRLSLTGRSGCTVARGAGDNNGLERAEKELESFGRVKLEDKEYFSGSLIESKKELVPALQRSSSYNADRSSKMGPTTEKDEEEVVRAKCIPRKPKSMALRNNGVHQ